MQDSKPTVAIIVPCFNRWPYIQDAIDSVLSQTWPETQCVVVDDASTDDTFARLEEAYGENPKVTIYQQSSNQGQSAARNRGAIICNTDYIGFLDSDDLLVGTSVASRMQLAMEKPTFEGIIFGDKVDGDTQQSLMPAKKTHASPLSLREYVSDRGWLCSNSFIMLRSSFLSLGGFNESLRKKEDVEFFLRALAAHNEALYASGPCCVVRDIGTHRARHDHERIIEQGQRFMAAIQNNPKLHNALTKAEVKKLTESDIKSVLQSLYRMKQGKKFRKNMQKAILSRKLQPRARHFKRYILSLFWKNKS